MVRMGASLSRADLTLLQKADTRVGLYEGFCGGVLSYAAITDLKLAAVWGEMNRLRTKMSGFWSTLVISTEKSMHE